MHAALLAFCLLCGPAMTEDTDSDWTRFRGPNGTGISRQPQPLPAQLDAAQAKWKVAVPPGHSSPIVVGQSIVITAFEANTLSTLCFALADGQLRWRRDLSVSAVEKVHPQHGPATPTPVSDGERIFVVFGSFGVLAYDLDGQELWRQERPARHNMFGSASSPVIVQGKLIVFTGSDEESLLQAIEPANGSVLWERQRPGPASSWSTPVEIHTGQVDALLFYEPYHLRACSLQDGQDLWSIPGLADEPITIPLVGDNRVYTTSYNLRTNKEAIGLPTFADLLSECDANGDGRIDPEEAKSNKSILSRPDADGEGDHPLRMFFRMLDQNQDRMIEASEWPLIHKWMESWNHANGLVAIQLAAQPEGTPTLAWVHADGVPECPSPLLVDQRIYAVRNGGVVTCVDAASGETLFFERIAAPGPYYASPVAGDGKIFLASARGTVTVLAAEPQPRVLGSCRFDEPIWATPALLNGGLIIRSAQHLYRF